MGHPTFHEVDCNVIIAKLSCAGFAYNKSKVAFVRFEIQNMDRSAVNRGIQCSGNIPEMFFICVFSVYNEINITNVNVCNKICAM